MRNLAFAPLLIVCAVSAHAQGRGNTSAAAKECAVQMDGVTRNGVLTTSFQFSGQDTTWVSGGVDAKCAGTDQRILADSAEHYADKKLLILIGHVHYTEARLKLDTDRLTYFTGEERLLAEGNVVSVTNTGTRFAGPHAIYLRPAPGIRDKSHLVAEPRSNIWVSPKDAGGDSKDSVNIQADHLTMDNDSLVYAKGVVVIERPDLLSTSDSAFVDNGAEFARLTQKPKVVGRGDRHFQLEGDIIDIFSRKREVEKVKSLGHAAATGDDVDLKADTIDLRISGQKLEHAFAWGRSRAHARSKDQEITADSIDVLMPNQQLRTMRALGTPIAESAPDSTKIKSKTLDFLRGDTITAHFDTAATSDTVKQAAIKEIYARGKPASAYYQVAPSGVGVTSNPNANYVRGDSITVLFHNRKVLTVRVKGHADGMYTEFVSDSTKAVKPADSTATKSAKPVKKPSETKQP